MSLVASLVALGVTLSAEPTALGLQLSSGVDEPEALLAALETGLEGAGERIVRVTVPSPDCPGNLSCVQLLTERADARGVLFVIAVGLGGHIQLSATRADPLGQNEELAGETVEALDFDAVEALGARWARPSPVPDLPSEPPPAEVDLDLPGVEPAGPPLATWVAGAVALAAGTAGVVTGVVALSERDALRYDGCQAGGCDPGRVDALERAAVATDVLFVSAGVAAAVALVSWWTGS